MLQASSVGGNQWGRHCDTHAAEGVTDRAGAATLTHLGVAYPDDEPGIHHAVPCALIVTQQAVDFEQVRVHGCSLQRQRYRHSTGHRSCAGIASHTWKPSMPHAWPNDPHLLVLSCSGKARHPALEQDDV